MSDGIYGYAASFIGAIGKSLKCDSAENVRTRLAAQDVSRGSLRLPARHRLPACRYLPECVAASMFVAPEVAAALAGVEEHLHWKQNPNYSDALLGEGHMDNYAYAELIGPHGFFAGDDFLLGLMILGPHRHYRDHFHPAPELYWLLTGPSEWKRDGGGFAPRDAGATIWHAPNVVHATRTREAPLLALWAWTRDVGHAAKLKI